MIDIYIDTEFTDLHPLEMKLISIGACADMSDGSMKTYYTELSDTYKKSQCSKFVKDVVLPLLENKHVQTYMEMILSFGKFIEDLEDDVRLISDAPAWDFPHILTLYTDKILCPANLKSLSVARNEVVIPEAVYLREHHALDDAIVNCLAVRELKRQGKENGIKDILKIN